MSTKNPMTQEQLDAIQERLDAVEVDPPDEYWSYGAGIAWVPFCEHARDDIPALLAEVERLRALTTVNDDMVERALRQSYGPKAWQEMCDSHDDCDVALVATSRDDMRGTLSAALDTGEEA